MEDYSRKILCIDDQRDASALLKRHLSSAFDCTIVNSAAQAMEALKQAGPFAVVVSDYAMPDVNGVELLREVKQRWPDTIGVMVTALNELDVAIAALHDGSVYRFVRKPWHADEILRAVNEAADYFRLIRDERKLREELARINAALDEKVGALDEANELLEYWMEFSPAVLYTLTLDDGLFHPSYVSKNFLRLTGYERTTAAIEPGFWAQLIVPHDLQRFDTARAEMAEGALTHTVVEYEIRHRNGAEVRVIDSMRAVHDADGTTVELVGAWMDVTLRL
jgi:PAS domain S-box-containing protein